MHELRLTGSFEGTGPIEPDDNAEHVADALLIGVPGSLAVIDSAGATRLIPYVRAGLYPLAVRAVLKTGTTAALILGIRAVTEVRSGLLHPDLLANAAEPRADA